MTTVDRRTIRNILTEEMANHGIDDDLIQDALPDILERMEAELDIELLNEDDEEEAPEESDD